MNLYESFKKNLNESGDIKEVGSDIISKYIEYWDGSNTEDPEIEKIYKDYDLLLANENGRWVAIDNRDGNCWTEEFPNREDAIAWLNDEFEMSDYLEKNNMDESCKSCKGNKCKDRKNINEADYDRVRSAHYVCNECGKSYWEELPDDISDDTIESILNDIQDKGVADPMDYNLPSQCSYCSSADVRIDSIQTKFTMKESVQDDIYYGFDDAWREAQFIKAELRFAKPDLNKLRDSIDVVCNSLERLGTAMDKKEKGLTEAEEVSGEDKIEEKEEKKKKFILSINGKNPVEYNIKDMQVEDAKKDYLDNEGTGYTIEDIDVSYIDETEEIKESADYYNWKKDIKDVEPTEENDDIWYAVAENMAQKGDEGTDDPLEIMSNIINLFKISKGSKLYKYLLKWYGSEEKLLSEVRDVYDTSDAIYFVTGTGYSIFDADLLGGNADGETERKFDSFVQEQEESDPEYSDDNEEVHIVYNGKIYYQFDRDEWYSLDPEEQETYIMDAADQASEEEGYTVDYDEIDIEEE